MPPGTPVKLGILRKNQEMTIDVTLGELPNPRGKAGAQVKTNDARAAGSDAASMGLTLVPANDLFGPAARGVIVARLEPGGVAAQRGFHIGDIILDVGGEVVSTLVDFNNRLAAAKQGGQVALARVKSDDTTRFIAIPVG